MQLEIASTYIVVYRKRSNDGVDKVDAGQNTRFVGLGQEAHQGTTHDTMSLFVSSLFIAYGREEFLPRNDASNDPSPAVRLLANSVADKQGKEDANNTARHVHECSLLRVVSNVADKSS